MEGLQQGIHTYHIYMNSNDHKTNENMQNLCPSYDYREAALWHLYTLQLVH